MQIGLYLIATSKGGRHIREMGLPPLLLLRTKNARRPLSERPRAFSVIEGRTYLKMPLKNSSI